jgi:hypothetical protein
VILKKGSILNSLVKFQLTKSISSESLYGNPFTIRNIDSRRFDLPLPFSPVIKVILLLKEYFEFRFL